MDRYKNIFSNQIYIDHVKACSEFEKSRIFCKHDMDHFLDVARIALLISKYDGMAIPKDIVYASALLHDIGRDEEYKTGIAHEEASATIAKQILEEAAYSDEENDMICKAILNHGNKLIKDELSLDGVLYRADKLSRKCYECSASSMCKWDDEKKNKYPVW